MEYKMVFASIYALIVGTGLVAQWAMSYSSNGIPELKTEPVRIGFHIAAEMLTAICLILSGISLISNMSYAVQLFLVSIGMLFYTSIVNLGYFTQKGQWAWLGLFRIIIVLGAVCVVLLF